MRACNIFAPRLPTPCHSICLICRKHVLMEVLLTAPGAKAADLSLEEADGMATMCRTQIRLRVISSWLKAGVSGFVMSTSCWTLITILLT